jgi:peroxiredoxin
MASTIHYIKKEKAWQKKHDTNAPKVGDLAPDFELTDASGEKQVRLSDFRGRQPVALVFGSFT